MLLLGTLSAILGWLPLAPAIVVAAVGAAVETFAALAFVRSRRGRKAAGQKGR